VSLDSPPRTKLVVGSRVFLPDEAAGPCGLLTTGGRIVSILRNLDMSDLEAGTEVVDLRPWWLAPGYVDLHTHGFRGHDVTTGSQADVAAMASALPCLSIDMARTS